MPTRSDDGSRVTVTTLAPPRVPRRPLPPCPRPSRRPAAADGGEPGTTARQAAGISRPAAAGRRDRRSHLPVLAADRRRLQHRRGGLHGVGDVDRGEHHLTPMFPVFRAHPLLFQTLLSLVLRVTARATGPRAASPPRSASRTVVGDVPARQEAVRDRRRAGGRALARRDALSRDREQASTARRPDDVLAHRGAVLRGALHGDWSRLAGCSHAAAR